MSQSFPSSNGWEPFSNSQQQHALGWRRPATKPALPAPPNPPAPRFPAISPWNHINRPSRSDPPSLSQPTLSPHDDLAISAAVCKQEHEHNKQTLQRFDALKTDVAAVDTKLVQIQTHVEDIRHKSQDSQTNITTELKRVYDQCRDLNRDLRTQASAHEDHVRACDAHLRRLEQHVKTLHTTVQTALADALRPILSNPVDHVIQSALDAATHRLTQHITHTADSLKAAIQTSTAPTANKQPKTPPNTSDVEHQPLPASPPGGYHTDSPRVHSLTREDFPFQPTRVHSPVPLLLQIHSPDDERALKVPNRRPSPNPAPGGELFIHSSDEEYALRVANRERPPKPTSTSSSQEEDSLDPRLMYTSDASTQDPAEAQCLEGRSQSWYRSATPLDHDSPMGLFEDSGNSSDSLTARMIGSYPERRVCSPLKSSRERTAYARNHRRGSRRPLGSQALRGVGKRHQRDVHLFCRRHAAQK